MPHGHRYAAQRLAPLQRTEVERFAGTLPQALSN
jgi:hypothetical protein